MSTIDYSKWDNIDCSSSEDEDQDTDSPRQPTVTRLDAPSTVTRTKDGQLVIENCKQQQQQQSRTIDFIAAQKKISPTAIVSGGNTDTSSSSSSVPPSWTDHGGEQALLLKGGWDQTQDPQPSTLYWSQDRYSVHLRLALPNSLATIKGKDITVRLEGVRRFRDRQAAVGSGCISKIHVVSSGPGTSPVTLLQGDFPHPIHATEDDDNYVDEDTPLISSDWTLDRNNKGDSLYWIMTLYKAVPMAGMVVWWRRPLTQFPERDDTHPRHGTAMSGGGDNPKAQAFQQAWDEAHRQFRDKTQQKKKDARAETS